MSLALIISFLTPGSVVAGGALGAAVSGWTLWTRSRRADERALGIKQTTAYWAREQPPVGQVTAFVDWLAEQPLREWLELGRAIAADRADVSVRGDAWDRVQSVIADQGMQLATWYVRDAVETAAFRPRTGPRNRRPWPFSRGRISHRSTSRRCMGHSRPDSTGPFA
jgi:hypothetical protein